VWIKVGAVGAVLTAAACAAGGSAEPAPPPPSSRVPSTSASAGSAARPAPAAAGSALAALAALPVKGRAPMTGYSREAFGPAWTDDTDADGGHNGCDTRNDVLRRDLRSIVLKPGTGGCVVLRGTLHDPYTGRAIDFLRGERTSLAVQIDHVVALADAWQTGAQQLPAGQRERLANDPLELLAVDGPTNQRKGAGDAATWLPPAKPFRCAYVGRQIAVKRAYHLWVTRAEADAMRRVLAACPGQALPRADDVPAR
jgi:hypothetical protein